MKYNKSIITAIVITFFILSAVIVLAVNKDSNTSQKPLEDSINNNNNFSLFEFNNKLLSFKVQKPTTLKTPKTGEEALNAILKNGKPTIISFTSEYCRDCQQVKPIIKKLEDTYKDKINFLVVDIRKNTSLNNAAIKKYRVFGVPLVVFIKKDCTKQKIITGYNPIDTYITQLDLLLKNK